MALTSTSGRAPPRVAARARANDTGQPTTSRAIPAANKLRHQAPWPFPITALRHSPRDALADGVRPFDVYLLLTFFIDIGSDAIMDLLPQRSLQGLVMTGSFVILVDWRDGLTSERIMALIGSAQDGYIDAC